ncbi:MAG TPA: metal-dependent transcriptional regulator [Methanocorpusculum sp.]|nr:metal-dependent transcriptional regulator [Methanocorpusculum sp.]
MERATSLKVALTIKQEDYLESILSVSLEKGYAKAKDVAEDLEVSPASASEMFSILDKKGLIVHRKYEGVTLTMVGKEIASQVRFRHNVLVKFLKNLGVPDFEADKDACFMEHELHAVTIQKIKEFVERRA